VADALHSRWPRILIRNLASKSRVCRVQKNNRIREATTVSLLDGANSRLDRDSLNFLADPDDPKRPKDLVGYQVPMERAAGSLRRRLSRTTPDKLCGLSQERVAEYSNGFTGCPPDSRLHWLTKQIVRSMAKRADWASSQWLKGNKDYSHNPVYTLPNHSYQGQLMEINFTSNLNTHRAKERDRPNHWTGASAKNENTTMAVTQIQPTSELNHDPFARFAGEWGYRNMICVFPSDFAQTDIRPSENI